jgi:cytochrome d ubiquinol oxidase subunit I
MVITSLILFTLVYGVLMAADIYLLAKYARAGPTVSSEKEASESTDSDLTFVPSQN